MDKFDKVITGGTIATASDQFQCDVGIANGKIAALGTNLSAEDEIDASGKLVLPGGIDSHVHISQPSGPNVVMADNFSSATLSAAYGGNTTILPFCLQEKGQSLRNALNWYHELAKDNCYTDVSFHLIITDPKKNVLHQELPALVAEGYSSVKVFMTYEGLKLSDREILETFEAAKACGALPMVHAENDDAIEFLRDHSLVQGDTEPKYHATTRPIPVEREATHRAISLAEIIDTPIVIVHVSNRQALEEIQKARERGLKIHGETCPQYLILTASDLDLSNFEGAKYVCSPPPRDFESQAACWEGLERGVFEIFSSDHCPFRLEDSEGKKTPNGLKNFRWIPNGIPGVETRLPILFSEGVVKGRINLQQFVAYTSTNHAKLYNLYPQKGSISVGSDADIVIWDPGLKKVIQQKDLHHGADYTPYEGLAITGWPIVTMLRGQTLVQNDKFLGSKGYGIHQARYVSDNSFKCFN